MFEQTCLFPSPPELDELESSQNHGRQAPARPGRRRWLPAALAAAALGALALCALSFSGRAPPRGGGPEAAEAAEREEEEEEGAAAGVKPVAELDLDLLHRTPVREFVEVEVEEPPVWINRGSGADNATVELADGPPVEAVGGRRLAPSCQSQLARVDSIRSQHLAPHSRDDLFPPEMKSISEPDANCGDTAKNIFKSCSKYNKWRKFQDVAASTNKDFAVIGNRGPNWHDIGQGELGTCYFLAALASIAYTDPQVIEDMFVERHKWSQNIFTTRWLVNGKLLEVEVDNYVPARSWGTFFVQPSSTGEWWPVILEKTWAKIAGNYKGAEGGSWPSPVLAMTAAPLARYRHGRVPADEVMSAMEEASRSGWPMGASTGPNCATYGLTGGHAYSVFKVFEMPGHGKVARVYNPWHNDNYRGSIPNKDRTDGVFTMTAAEYHDAFASTTVAEVKNNYKVTTQQIQSELQKTTAWEFDVPFDGEFVVSVSWPIERMFSGCANEEPKVTLAVMKDGSDEPIMAVRPDFGISTTAAKVTSGRGRYTATAAVVFPAGNEVPEANLVVYAPETVQIQAHAGHPTEKLLSIFGAAENGKPCPVVFIEGYGNFVLKMDVLVSNVPTYWGVGDEELAYWAPDQNMWLLIQSRYLAKIQAGELWSFAKVTKKHMTCGCKDNPKGVAGFQGVYCNQVKGADAIYVNVKCEGSPHSDLVKRYCPVTCDADFCRPGAPTPAPTPSPSRETGGDKAQQHCIDAKPTSIRLNGKFAECPQLKDLCQVHAFVKERCCDTCAVRAESEGLPDDKNCRDHTPPGFMSNRGHRFKSCQELKGFCSSNHAVPERCCATCEKDKDLKEDCTDAPVPNLQLQSGKTFHCSGWASYCSNPRVKEECCKTCSGR